MDNEFFSDYKDKRRMTVPPGLSSEVQQKILELTITGLPIMQICKQIGISYQTLARCIIRDPLFQNEWEKARAMAAHIVADELRTIADHATTAADAMVARVKSDNLRTSAAWLNPNRYGPKQQIEVQHTVDLSKALDQANERLKIADDLVQNQHKRHIPRKVEQHHIDRAIGRHDFADAKDIGDQAAHIFSREPIEVPSELLEPRIDPRTANKPTINHRDAYKVHQYKYSDGHTNPSINTQTPVKTDLNTKDNDTETEHDT